MAEIDEYEDMTREQLKAEITQFIRNRKYLAENAVSSSGELLREDHAIVADLITRMDAYIDELEDNAWQSIETAPKYKDVLVYREDAGIFMARYSSLDGLISTIEIEKNELDEETIFQEDWFESGIYARLEGDEKPTHWMPLPILPKQG